MPAASDRKHLQSRGSQKTELPGSIWLMWMTGFELEALCFQGKHFSISPFPGGLCRLFLKLISHFNHSSDK